MKTKPLKHQKKVMRILKKHDYYYLMLDMGTGKTWLGCWLSEEIKGKILIVCPNKIKPVWEKEFKKHTNKIDLNRVILLHGPKERKVKFIDILKYDIFIINYESLFSIEKQLKKLNCPTIISDETHRIKNNSSKQTRSLMRISVNSKKRFALSGTPQPQGAHDLFSQVRFLDRGDLFGYNYQAFLDDYFYDENRYNPNINFPNYKIRPALEKEFFKKIKTLSIRIDARDCLDLPPDFTKEFYCYMSPQQTKAYKEMTKECITFFESGEATAKTAAVKALRLNQITSGFLNKTDGKAHFFKQNPKLDLLKETVEERIKESKIIIWAHYHNDIEAIYKMFKKYNPVVVYGGKKIKQAGDPEKIFQEDDSCRMFIGSPASGGEGLTLTQAKYAIRYSYSFNSLHWNQSKKRNLRKGSEIHDEIIFINLIMYKTIDDHIIKSVEDKNMNAQRLYDYLKKELVEDLKCLK